MRGLAIAFVTVYKVALGVSSARGFQGYGGLNVIAANKIFFLTSSLG